MQSGKLSQYEIYSSFIAFIKDDMHLERKKMNRRIFNIVFWCILLPLLISIGVIALMVRGFISVTLLPYYEWVILVFPLIYAAYFFGSEVLIQLPRTIRKGGMQTALEQMNEDTQWRNRHCQRLKSLLKLDSSMWKMIHTHFGMDLQNMRSRSNYMMVLVGTMFFMVVQVIDLIAAQEQGKVMLDRITVLEIVFRFYNNFSLLLVLGLFLLLFYMVSMQTHHSLQKYRDCVEILISES